MPIVIPAALIAALALATTWWQTVMALIAIAVYILSMSGIHYCRGFFFANKEGRKSIILMLVNLDPTPAGIVSKALVVTNAWFDPFVRYLRWRWGILTSARRNSEGEVAVWGFNDYCITAYLVYLGSGLVTGGVSYAQLLIGLGVVQVTSGSPVDGSVLQDTKAMQLGLGISMDYVITNSNIILILFHLVLADPQLRYFVLLIVRAWCYWGGAGLLAPLLSPRLFKLYIAAAEDVRPFAMAFLAALKRKDEAEVRRLRSILDARLEKWDRALAKEYNDPAQRSLLKRNDGCVGRSGSLHVLEALDDLDRGTTSGHAVVVRMSG